MSRGFLKLSAMNKAQQSLSRLLASGLAGNRKSLALANILANAHGDGLAQFVRIEMKGKPISDKVLALTALRRAGITDAAGELENELKMAGPEALTLEEKWEVWS